jgi:hypothetical protein
LMEGGHKGPVLLPKIDGRPIAAIPERCGRNSAAAEPDH